MTETTSQIPMLVKPTAVHPRRDRVRLTILIFRKSGMGTEEFQNYWRDEHSQLFAHLPIVKKNLLKYEQGHNDEAQTAKLKEIGFPTLSCDGMAVFEAATWEKLEEVFTDKAYVDQVIPDEEKFLDRGKSQAFPSTIVGLFDDPS